MSQRMSAHIVIVVISRSRSGVKQSHAKRIGKSTSGTSERLGRACAVVWWCLNTEVQASIRVATSAKSNAENVWLCNYKMIWIVDSHSIWNLPNLQQLGYKWLKGIAARRLFSQTRHQHTRFYANYAHDRWLFEHQRSLVPGCKPWHEMKRPQEGFLLVIWYFI